MEVKTYEDVRYQLSEHVKQRYVERIIGKEDTYDIKQFIATHAEKIDTDIHKLIRYGECIYSGKQSQKESKGNVIDVYVKDCWIILVDNKLNKVITLYKVDLGLDDDFNKSYVIKMLSKLGEHKAALDAAAHQVQTENNTYRELITEAETQIKEYKAMIRNLEALCEGYKTLIDNNSVKITQANKSVTDVLNQLIGKREF